MVLFYRRANSSDDDQPEQRAIQETVAEINKRHAALQIHSEPWIGDNPTDHRSIFDFLQEKTPALRRRFAARELVIHVSPGTPAMHTIWVLMAETVFIEPPFSVVQRYRKSERRGRPAVVPVQLGIDTFYAISRVSSSRLDHILEFRSTARSARNELRRSAVYVADDVYVFHSYYDEVTVTKIRDIRRWLERPEVSETIDIAKAALAPFGIEYISWHDPRLGASQLFDDLPEATLRDVLFNFEIYR